MNIKPKTGRLLLLCYIYFGLIGFILGMRTSVFYFVQESYLDSYSPLANMILISGLCMQVSLYLAGVFIQKIGYKSLLNIGMAAFAIPVILMYFIDSFIGFAVTYTLLMVAYGIAVIILNLYVSVLIPDRKSNNLMILHLFFCLGALSGPKWIDYFNGINIPWQIVLAAAGIPLAVVFVVTLGTKAEKMIPGTTAGEIEGHEPTAKEPTKKGSSSLTAVLVVVFMCSQVWEYGTGTWFVIFVSKTDGRQAQGALLLTLFYAMYPLVRIVLARTIHRFNLLNLLIGAFFSSAFFASLGVILKMPVFFSLTGLGVAVLYPAFMAFMQEELGQSATRRIGWITMTGGLLQYIAIWSIGLFSDWWGIEDGFHSMVVYLIIGTLGLVVIKANKSFGIFDMLRANIRGAD